MFTKADFLVGLPSIIRQLCPTGEALPPAADLAAELGGEDGNFEFLPEGVWFAVGNEDRLYRYADATASEALQGLLALYRAWGVEYTPATGFYL